MALSMDRRLTNGYSQKRELKCQQHLRNVHERIGEPGRNRTSNPLLSLSTIQIPTISAHFAALTRSWPLPAAAEIRNTTLGFADVREVGFGLSTGHVQDDIDVVLVLTRQEFSNVPARIDPNSTYGVELRRRQELQEATLPFRGGKIRFENNSTATTKESGRALDAVLAEMKRDRRLRVLVKAYADWSEGRPIHIEPLQTHESLPRTKTPLRHWRHV